MSLHASDHLAAVVSGFNPGTSADWVEMNANPNPLFEAVVASPPRVEGGCLVLGNMPGLGVELNDAKAARWLVGRNGAERVSQKG